MTISNGDDRDHYVKAIKAADAFVSTISMLIEVDNPATDALVAAAQTARREAWLMLEAFDAKWHPRTASGKLPLFRS